MAGAANYYFGGYVGSPVRLTDVGAYGPNSVSYYGTNDQGGNVMEWTDAISAYDSMRIPRGGSWNDNLGYFLRSTSRDYYVPLNGYSDYTGFRIASVYVFSPIEIWLQSKGFPFDTDIKSDHNNDGVNILMAYALNLDPNLNLSGEMPRPVNTPDHDSLSFYAAASGVTYTVETSTDLQHWTTEGVSLSDLKANSITATVKRDGANRFMRLVVSK
ncbi:MAG: hypothetical protein NTV46_11415 [Verrucomicrobia bacterium]|nr:hypothetical protein [Verrucomicrobiota bacterium]